MKFKPGDQVSFVNEKGGGIVIAVTRNGSYKVALEDGFDLTMTEKELTLVSTTKVPDAEKTKPSENISEGEKSFLITPGNEVTLVTVPAFENRLLTGDITFYLVNRTDFFIQFVLSYVSGKEHVLMSSGLIKSGEEKETGTFSRPEMTGWNHLHIQLLLSKETAYRFVPPVYRDIPLLLPDLSNTTGENGRFAFARYESVFRDVIEEDIETQRLMDKFHALQIKHEESGQPESNRRKLPFMDDSRYGILRNTAVVDLHIEELVKDISGLDHVHALEIQIKKFQKEMDFAILNHFHSITFIHGVGAGILRKALIEELKHYRNVNWRNGDYHKYGTGAIEVLLK